MVFFRFDIRFIPRPQGLHRVQGPRFCLFFFRCIFDGLSVFVLRLYLGRKVHGDRVADVVGILLDQALEDHLVGVVFFAIVAIEFAVQMEDDRRPVLRFLAFFEVYSPLPVDSHL